MPISPRERPFRMMRSGRAEDQDFSPSELMYRRYLQDDFEGESFRPARFSFPPSLNRQRYSEPEDVIFSETGEFDDCGVLECSVEQLSVRLLDDRNVEYGFVPVHRPEENNYSHSEIWAKSSQSNAPTPQPSKVARKMYRTFASKLLKVKIEAKR